MSKVLSITDEKIKEAAATCPQVERALKVLFPEVFQPVDDKRVRFTEVKGHSSTERSLLEIRAFGSDLEGSVFLSSGYNWTIETDNKGSLCLVARKG